MNNNIVELAKNYVSYQVDSDDFVQFCRFSTTQALPYKQTSLWQLFADSCAGVEFAFQTNGSRLEFQCRKTHLFKMLLCSFGVRKKMQVSKQGKATASKRIREIRLNPFQPFEGFDLLVNNVLVDFCGRKNGKIVLHFENPKQEFKEVRIIFPNILGVKVKSLRSNGEVKPSVAKKPTMLCLGDSITQGQICPNPSHSYVARVADGLSMNALNQAVGGYFYDPETLTGLETLPEPALITVAYGTNDWAFNPNFHDIESNVRAYYQKLLSYFPAVPIYAITPIWRAEAKFGAQCGDFDQIAKLIKQVCSQYPNITVIDGMTLVPHQPDYFYDRFLHPNDAGFKCMAEGILHSIRADQVA